MENMDFRKNEVLNQLTFDRWRRFSTSRAATVLLFAWAVAEAIFWPIVPDFILVPVSAVGGGRYWKLLGAAVAGSCLGGAAMYLWSYFMPALARSVLPHLPVVQQFMIRRAISVLDQQGVMAFWTQPWSGVSYKIFAIEAAGRGLNPVLVLPISFLARALRMLADSVVGTLAVWRFPGFFRNHWIYIALAYLIIIAFVWITTQLMG
jgi:membrane protein YqaA with SNARE-associated domain